MDNQHPPRPDQPDVLARKLAELRSQNTNPPAVASPVRRRNHPSRRARAVAAIGSVGSSLLVGVALYHADHGAAALTTGSGPAAGPDDPVATPDTDRRTASLSDLLPSTTTSAATPTASTTSAAATRPTTPVVAATTTSPGATTVPVPATMPSATTVPATTTIPAGTTATGPYQDGTWTGQAVQTRWGPVQVVATISGGHVVAVQATQTPTGRKSDEINARATPILRAEALKVQTADLDNVSGATYTSDGYRSSLQGALDQAAHRVSSETVSYYLSRSTGIVALVLMVLALVGGLLFSGRAAPRWRTPAWWLDLHNYLGGLALIFTAVHLATVYADTLSGVGLVQILVPHTAQRDRTAITLGVAATYCAAATVFTTWPRRLAHRRVWLAVHLTSGPAACAAAAHAWMAGSSRGGLWVEAGLAAMVGLAVYGLMLRINRTWRRRFGPGPARVRR